MRDGQTNTFRLDGPYLDILELRHSGLCCSQIIVKLILLDCGLDNPDLVRAMAALCFGGNGRGGCGILTGAACALSIALGNGREKELPDGRLPLMLGELSDWFAAEIERASYGGIRCEEILAASPDKRACTLLLVSTLEKLRAILTSVNGAAGCDNDQP